MYDHYNIYTHNVVNWKYIEISDILQSFAWADIILFDYLLSRDSR